MPEACAMEWIPEKIFSGTQSMAQVVSEQTRCCEPSQERQQLSKVQQIQGTDLAFAAILADGFVVTLGSPDYGGDLRILRCELP